MKEATRRTEQKTRSEASAELRVVAINCNPAPDAQDRLRRLFTILAKLTRDEEASPADPSPQYDLDRSC
ncbi:MAG: hypothetical protein OYI31_06540 [Chloroflexota bacterium]|nr:hypothetical protein [Chloroflexota bacterium]